MNRTTSTLISIGLSAALVALGAWFLYRHSWVGLWPENGRWIMGHHGIMGGGMGIVMVIFWGVVIGALVLLISGAVNNLRSDKTRPDQATDPVEILKRRYARGEINKAEFEDMRRDLMG